MARAPALTPMGSLGGGGARARPSLCSSFRGRHGWDGRPHRNGLVGSSGGLGMCRGPSGLTQKHASGRGVSCASSSSGRDAAGGSWENDPPLEREENDSSDAREASPPSASNPPSSSSTDRTQQQQQQSQQQQHQSRDAGSLLPRPRLPFLSNNNNNNSAHAPQEEQPSSSSDTSSHPYDSKEYIELTLQFIQSSTEGAPKGTLALTRTEDNIDETTLALVVGIGGDTLLSIVNHVQGHVPDRPLALDLVAKMLDEGMPIASSSSSSFTENPITSWQQRKNDDSTATATSSSTSFAPKMRLTRVAVISCVNDVFYGRMYFEDAETGAPLWDCDCRPSDGLWLSMRYDAPFVVHNAVWEKCALRLYDLVDEEDLQDMEYGDDVDLDGYDSDDSDDDEHDVDLTDEELQQVEDFLDDLDGAISDINAGKSSGRARRRRRRAEKDEPEEQYYALNRIRDDDPEPVKRLKMELTVALNEEDYATAAKIRDHPFLQMHQNMLRQIRNGNREEADFLRRQLNVDIANSETPNSDEVQEEDKRDGTGEKESGWC
uniref:BFN domain-containing protein n=1 Tax=Pycnococcus provasolii TaxID=41880 RepID=A0A7S2AIZ2_9CHLO|mmetsp:Transcript_11906/g.26984  ORF Transcript_11906/g.26984 Transcript_11906/m.26984 type:complete len:547 (+) Transcript_11906:72-1712(+)